MTATAETLARRRGRCRLCRQPIVADQDYVAKVEPIGWVHAECGAGYRRVIAEHEEPADDFEHDRSAATR